MFGFIVATTVSLISNCSYMAKTNPIGVRFDEELLNKVKEAALANSPQKALNLYEKSYVELIERKVVENNKPENKKRIEEERNPVANDNHKNKHYDYSKMPKKLSMIQQLVWKENARAEQDK